MNKEQPLIETGLTALQRLNGLSDDAFREALTKCCGAQRWVNQMLEQRPFQNPEQLFQVAEAVWNTLSPSDWQEAFEHHPKIGDINSLKAKYANTQAWAQGEQAGVEQATEDVLQALALGNQDYENRFGYIFIVCATGKSAQEMLSLLQARLGNAPETELAIAAGEQAKITRIRLEKLLND